MLTNCYDTYTTQPDLSDQQGRSQRGSRVEHGERASVVPLPPVTIVGARGNIMVTREQVPSQPGKVRITFSLPSSIWADRVQLVGDFNDWNTASMPLRRDENCWSISMLLDLGHSYAYRYLVDHEWMTDWNADGFVTGSDGHHHSVVVARPPAPAPAIG